MKLQVSCLINPAPPAAGLTPETYASRRLHHAR